MTVTLIDVDEIAPLITSPLTARVAASTGYAVTLTANETVTFEKLTGADSAAFTLAGATLTLPAQAYNAGKATYTCNLRAVDSAGNPTQFTHVVTIIAPASLTLGGPMTFTPGAAAGTLVFTIGGVPPGVTPALSPADNRVIIAGDASGWKGVVGSVASSTGTLEYALTAAGAIGVAVRVTVAVAAGTIPANVLTLLGEPLTLAGEYLTLGE